MHLAPLDLAIVVLYVVFALAVGVILSRRASQDTEEYFLSGRSLPWWLAGTSMVATTFAADTPLVVSGWVRDGGIWENWLWWCYAISGSATIFLFARYWRRGRIVTTAEMAELRYGGRGASSLRAMLGFYQAAIYNTLVLTWVLLAAAKITDVLFDVDKATALLVISSIALVYSILAGFWGVVVTDIVQFIIAMVGSIALAYLAWQDFGGSTALWQAVEDGVITPEHVALIPDPGPGGFWSINTWTAPFAAFAVFLGVAWWAKDGVDGGSVVVQRISATKDERHGMKAVLWYQVANYALRPWPWILVALVSLSVLPHREVQAERAGVVQAVDAAAGEVLLKDASGELYTESWSVEDPWSPVPSVKLDAVVVVGSTIAATDSERAYPAMMARYLPVGLLGLVLASLLAAFMSTIDTHVNLASSFFVNDVYRRFLHKGASEKHYVLVARLATVAVLVVGAYAAFYAQSIATLFEFFLTFLGGVGPVYVARWFWWRVRASTEIAAMVASSVAAISLTYLDIPWAETTLSPGGELSHVGRLMLVVSFSGLAALVSVFVTRTPQPETLVEFYRRVRPIGFWGPVRELAGVGTPRGEVRVVSIGIVGALLLTYGALFAPGHWFLGRDQAALLSLGVAVIGALATGWAVGQLGRPEYQTGQEQ